MFELVDAETVAADRRFLAGIYEVLADNAPAPIEDDVTTLHRALRRAAEGDAAVATTPDVQAAMAKVESWVDTHCQDNPE